MTSAISGKRSGLGTAPKASSTSVTTRSETPDAASASNQFVSVKSRNVDGVASSSSPCARRVSTKARDWSSSESTMTPSKSNMISLSRDTTPPGDASDAPDLEGRTTGRQPTRRATVRQPGAPATDDEDERSSAGGGQQGGAHPGPEAGLLSSTVMIGMPYRSGTKRPSEPVMYGSYQSLPTGRPLSADMRRPKARAPGPLQSMMPPRECRLTTTSKRPRRCASSAFVSGSDPGDDPPVRPGAPGSFRAPSRRRQFRVGRLRFRSTSRALPRVRRAYRPGWRTPARRCGSAPGAPAGAREGSSPADARPASRTRCRGRRRRPAVAGRPRRSG